MSSEMVRLDLQGVGTIKPRKKIVGGRSIKPTPQKFNSEFTPEKWWDIQDVSVIFQVHFLLFKLQAE